MNSTSLPLGPGPIFVTGAGGFIGAHAAASFEGAGRRVVRFGRHLGVTSGQASARNFDGPVDMETLSRVAATFGPPAILVHAAGGSSVAASVANPAADFERTVGSLRAVLDFLGQNAPEARLVFLSSAAVYGSVGVAPIVEGSPLRPISPYGMNKKLAEDLIHERARQRGLDATILRLFSVYGPGNRKQLLWDVANRLRADPKTLELSGTGDEARDFLYIDDAVRLIRILAERAPGQAPLVVNGGSGTAVTVREAAEALCRALGAKTRIVFTGAQRAGDPVRMISDQSLAQSLGFVPSVSFDAGVRRYADWASKAISEEEPKAELASRRV